MSLVHYGFSREEVYWMPISELEDYIKLINEQRERENDEISGNQNSVDKTPRTFQDVFSPNMKNPLRK